MTISSFLNDYLQLDNEIKWDPQDRNLELNLPSFPKIDLSSNSLALIGKSFTVHSAICAIGKALKYNTDPGGVCNAIAMLSIQAYLAGEDSSFKERFLLLSGLYIKHFGDLEKIADEIQSNPHLLTNLRAFYDSIEIFQQPHLYADLFEDDQRPKSQETGKVLKLTESIALESKGGLTELGMYSGVYNKEELGSFLSLTKKACEDADQKEPVGIKISSQLRGVNHAISVVYDNQKKSWLFIDVNNPPVKETKNLEDILLYIFQSYETAFKSSVVLESSFFALESNSASLKEQLEKMHSSDEFQRIHETTPDKAKFVNSSKVSWLLIASKIGDTRAVRGLIASGADKNLSPTAGVTPLALAEFLGHTEIVNLLST